MKHDDFLVEIFTEELPPKSLLKLAEAFCLQIKDRLQKAELAFEDIVYYATPRRLAVQVKKLAAANPDQQVERKGPALAAAYDAAGKPTPACAGFARSLGIEPNELQVIKTAQGEWVGYLQTVPGKPVSELLPEIITQAINALPIAKRMRWGAGTVEFVRPVHAITMLYGKQLIEATILGCQTDRKTFGHRFHAPDSLSISSAADYVKLLEKSGHVMVDIDQRRDAICQQAKDCVQEKVGAKAEVYFTSDALLNEVTGLVEWPQAICGQFDDKFLKLPAEVLISSMQDHQRYFPVRDAATKALLPYFVTISNIQSKDVDQVIQGNQRVLRARLSDAAFFYETDKKEKAADRLSRLKDIVFQAKLGSLHEKAERVSRLAGIIAKEVHADEAAAVRAGLLAKSDLTSQMVGEFPELQGVMGCYYAKHEGEPAVVAAAIQEHYQPRFAGDDLPASVIGQIVALADKLDTLVGWFGVNQIPTGDKDPYGLRRAAVGVLRLLIEGNMNLDLKNLLEAAKAGYGDKLENKEVVSQLIAFVLERLRVWYQDQGVSADIFAAVTALSISNLLDMHQRVKAVQAFKKLSEAETLSIANKRVSNILSKYVDAIGATNIDPAFFEHNAERELALVLEKKAEMVGRLYQQGKYDEVLLQLADLRQPVDGFFEHVMVMTEDKSQRENRILMLKKLRALFLQVADIALLQ